MHLNFLLRLLGDDEIEMVLFDFCLDRCDWLPSAADNSGCKGDGWWLWSVIALALKGEWVASSSDDLLEVRGNREKWKWKMESTEHLMDQRGSGAGAFGSVEGEPFRGY